MTSVPSANAAPATADEGLVQLQAAVEGGGDVWDIAAVALSLAWLDRPAADFSAGFQHLEKLRQIAADWPAGEEDVAVAADRLSGYLAGTLGYEGDKSDYDDMKNADLSHVIERRRGLPVALSVLYLHMGRAAGWRMEGLNTPGHFLIRLTVAGESAILDPFRRGARLALSEVEDLLRAVMGPSFDASRSDRNQRPPLSAYLTPVSDCDILLRLLNNIKLRAAAAGQFGRAEEIALRMRLLAPSQFALARDAALLANENGNLQNALKAARDYADLAPTPAHRDAAEKLLLRLRKRLN